MRYLLLTGLSGAGKTAALRFLEDMGVFCIDNLPPMMIMKFMEMWEAATPARSCVAFSVDARSGSFFDAHSVTKLILETKQLGKPVETIFLEASDDALVQRYKETRREHPLAGDSVTLTEAIAKDRETPGAFLFPIPSVPLAVIVPWILAQRGDAVPLSPPELVDAVRHDAALIAQKLSSPTGKMSSSKAKDTA